MPGKLQGKKTWVDVMIQGLWDQQFEAIIDVKIGNTDDDSYKDELIAALLDSWEISRSTITVSTLTTNGNTYFRLFFQWE